MSENELNGEKGIRLCRLIYVCFGLAAAFALYASGCAMWIEFGAASTAKYLAAALLVCALAAAAGRAGSGRAWAWFAVLLTVFAFAVRLGFVMLADTQPESDFSLLYDAAAKLAAGQNVMNTSEYFMNWAYQSGYVLFLAFFMRFFGAGLMFFKILNCLMSAFTALMVYLLARRTGAERGAGAAGLLYAIYPGTIYLCPVITPQHLAELLMLLAVYVFTAPRQTRRGGIWGAAAAGLLLGLSNIARPTGIVLAAALIVLALLCCLARGKGLGTELLRVLAALAAYFACTKGASAAVAALGVNNNGLSNTLPEWKFILGLNVESCGSYSDGDVAAVFMSPDSHAAAKALLKERMSISFPDFLKLAFRKSMHMWGDQEPFSWAVTESVSAQLAASYGSAVAADVLSRAEKISAAMYFWIFALAAAGAVPMTRKGKLSEAYALLAMTALAYFCVHFFIEIQPRYRSLMYAVTFPLAAAGAEACLGAISGLRGRKKNTA